MAEFENSVGESDDWHTPKKYFDAIGLTYDLDPAHPGIGAPHCFVPVRKVYTIKDDGLKIPWFGLVFCNPPYGERYGHVPWLRKLIAHANGIGLFWRVHVGRLVSRRAAAGESGAHVSARQNQVRSDWRLAGTRKRIHRIG